MAYSLNVMGTQKENKHCPRVNLRWMLKPTRRVPAWRRAAPRVEAQPTNIKRNSLNVSGLTLIC
eukprot:9328068-Pyramimonas_sp.AAC.2